MALVVIWYILLGLIIAASCILNTALLKYTLLKSPLRFKERGTISLSISDFMRAILGYSIELTIFLFNLPKHKICVSFGFLIPFFSYTAIFQLTELLLERWIKLRRNRRREELSTSNAKSHLAIGFCWTLALILSGMPLLGIGAYELETNDMTCSVVWKSTSKFGTAYVFVLFSFAFITPLMMIIISFIGTQRIIRKSRIVMLDRFGMDPTSAVIQMKYRAERRNTWVFFNVAFFFILAWTPYAVISFIAVFSSKSIVPDVVKAIAVMPAKASSMQSPLILAYFDSGFRSFLIRLPRCRIPSSELRPASRVNSAQI